MERPVLVYTTYPSLVEAERAGKRQAEALLQARQAELAGQTELAANLRNTAEQAAKQATELKSAADQARNQSANLLEGKDANQISVFQFDYR